MRQLNIVARQVLEVLREHYPNDPQYVAEKRARLAVQNEQQTLRWCNNLDNQNRAAVAARLGVDQDEFAVTLDTLRHL